MTTGATVSMSTSDRIKAELKARVKARRKDSEGPVKVEAAPPMPIEHWFNDSAKSDADDSMISLSKLIPNWKSTKGVSDIKVHLYNLSDYDDEAKAHIPEIDPFYRPNLKALTQLAYAVEHTDMPILLTGPASVGKTSLMKYFAAITNRPFYRINFNGSMDSSSILGTISASAGSTEWHDGFLTEAIKIPNAIIGLDEWTVCPPEIIMSLQNVLERNGRLMLTDKPGDAQDKIVHPANGVRFILADNTRGNGDTSGKYVGTQPQNSATLDRIGTFIQVDFLNRNDEVDMLMASFPLATKKLVDCMVQVANLCRTSYNQGNLSVQLSSRVLYSWLNHALNLREYREALEIAYINRFDSDAEKQAVWGFVDQVFGYDK